MKNKKFLINILLIFLLTSCKGNSVDGFREDLALLGLDNSSTLYATFEMSGELLDSSGKSIENAEVISNGATVMTGSSGNFTTLATEPVSKGSVKVKTSYQKNGTVYGNSNVDVSVDTSTGKTSLSSNSAAISTSIRNTDSGVSLSNIGVSGAIFSKLGEKVAYYKTSGVLTDENGNPIANAKVTLANGTEVYTDANGRYTISIFTVIGNETLSSLENGGTVSDNSNPVELSFEKDGVSLGSITLQMEVDSSSGSTNILSQEGVLDGVNLSELTSTDCVIISPGSEPAIANSDNLNTLSGGTLTNLNYADSPYTLLVGLSVSITPGITGTPIDCVSDVELPSGLTIDKTTCTISGTPTVETSLTDYIITASSELSTTSSVVRISTPIDSNAPTLSSDTLTASNITGTGLTLSWTGATDDYATASEIQYQVYYLLDETTTQNPAYDTVAEVEAGTAVNSAPANITSYDVTGLTEGKSAYWFNIVAQDQLGNKTVYTKKMINTAIFIIDGDNFNGGEIGGYTGANTKCETSKISYDSNYLKCNGMRALISFSGYDLINAPSDNGFSSALPVYGFDVPPTKTFLSSNWSGLFSGSISATLATAIGISIQPWTFSTTSGTYDSTNNCSDGTSTSGNGIIGNNGITTSAWISDTTSACSNTQTIECLCY